MKEIVLDEKLIVKDIVNPIRKGNFICVILEQKLFRQKLINIFKKYKITKRRGLFGFNGYALLVYSLPSEYEKLFDYIIKIVKR